MLWEHRVGVFDLEVVAVKLKRSREVWRIPCSKEWRLGPVVCSCFNVFELFPVGECLAENSEEKAGGSGAAVAMWHSCPILVCLTTTPLLTAVLYFLLQVSFLVDEGVSPVLLQLLSCALCGSKVLAALAASTGSSSTASSSAPVASSSGQATTQSKSSTKKSKKEEKEKEKDGKSHPLVLVIGEKCLSLFWIMYFVLKL